MTTDLLWHSSYSSIIAKTLLNVCCGLGPLLAACSMFVLLYNVDLCNNVLSMHDDILVISHEHKTLSYS